MAVLYGLGAFSVMVHAKQSSNYPQRIYYLWTKCNIRRNVFSNQTLFGQTENKHLLICPSSVKQLKHCLGFKSKYVTQKPFSFFIKQNNTFLPMY